MIRVCFVRGKYLNNFEGQNFLFRKKDIQLTAVSSLFPLNRHFPFPVKKLSSPVDSPFLSRGIKYLGNRLFGDSQILFGLEKLAYDFDIFHTADPHYFYSYQLAKLRRKNLIKKLIVTSWETIPFNNESIERKRYIKYFTFNQTDHFVCYTKRAKKTLIKEGVIPEKISVIRLGVNLDLFKMNIDKIPRSRKFVNNKQLIILFVGRLVEEKGVLDLYEAFKQIKNLKLKIIGEGILKSKLKRLISEDNLENFVSIEKRDYEKMPKVYQEADILVLPSKRTRTWEEQYGMVLVEAMASGLPIVAYNSGAITEVLDKAGILIDEGNINDLIVTINRLIVTDELRTKLGKIGRKRAEKEFDSRKTAKEIAEIYNKIVNS